jgi:hypothetical protein
MINRGAECNCFELPKKYTKFSLDGIIIKQFCNLHTLRTERKSIPSADDKIKVLEDRIKKLEEENEK